MGLFGQLKDQIDVDRVANQVASRAGGTPMARRADAMLASAGRSLGLGGYLSAAFKEPYNLILFAGGVAAGVVSGLFPIVWPIVGALELLYVFGVGTNPRYQAVVRARERGAVAAGGSASDGSAATSAGAKEAQRATQQLVTSLSADRQKRFEDVRRRCVELQRGLRQGASSGAAASGQDLLESSQQDSINQLLWVFLRTLAFEQVLDGFVSGMPRRELESTLERTNEALADPKASEKMKEAHRENLLVLEKRLDNLRHAEENREVIRARLVRVEHSILLIQEQALTRQDPAFIEAEVSAVTAGLSSVQEMVEEMNLPQLDPVTSTGPLPDFLAAGPTMPTVPQGLPPLPLAPSQAAKPMRQR